MKSSRFCLQLVSIFCVLAFFVGCSSQIQKADKLAMSDPKSAIASYEQVMKSKPGTDEAKQAHLKIADTYYKQGNDPQKGLEVYEEVAKAYPKTSYAGEAEKAIGIHYFQAKDYDKAIEAFNKAAEESPGTDVASDSLLMVGKSCEEAKKFEDAVKVYLDFAKNHPTHRLAAQAALTAAQIYEKELDKEDEAIETYKFVASKYSISSSAREAREALTNLGVDASEIPTGTAQAGAGTSQVQADQSQNEPKPMAQIGQRTRRRATNAPPPEIGSIRRTESTGPQGAQTAQATAAQSRSVSPDFGIDPLNLIPDISVDQQGTMYDAIYMIGITYLQAGQFKESGALFEKAIQLVGNKPWNNAASAYFLLGKSYKGIGNNEKAAQMLKEAIKRDSKVIDQMIRDGETQYGEEEYEKALDYYKTALGLVPYKDWEIYYRMGLVYQKLKDPDKELEAFERAVAQKPSDTDALQHLAEVLYYRKGNPTRATLFDAEVKGQGNNDYRVQKEIGDLCYKYESYSWAGTKYGSGVRIITLQINDELKKALGTGEEAKKISEDPTKIDLKLVSDAVAAGNTKAIEALQKIAPLLDDYHYMYARRALSQIRNKQFSDAQKVLDEAKEKDPGVVDSAEYQYALGELNVNPDNKQGNKEAGITALKKAVELNPQHQEAINKLKELGL